MKDKKTSELLDILNSIDDTTKLNTYINETKTAFNNLDFCTYFQNILHEKKLKKSKIIDDSNLDRTYAYQILSGKKKPSRDKILQLCIAAKLNLEEIQRILTLGNVGQLYVKDSRDSAIIFAIKKNLNVTTTNHLLSDLNFDLLGDC
ncbi:XRE family transcriptional regulator [Clostridium senegalense]|uniref:XRE family transcriptional regulator n=1 Tax=Clostridium senegalense TaxID=1465809 RepID=UPI001C0FC08D|nr:XRE family transcriptional regulator [Clostridium senegalense]MBU5227207.1 XRE family transcriptional regulator [Clostridium senegalense]